jgi:hypothetical protein
MWERADSSGLLPPSQAYIRFYDPGSGVYYYFDKRSKEVQWHKPYCLKGAADLQPPLDQRTAARRILNFFL